MAMPYLWAVFAIATTAAASNTGRAGGISVGGTKVLVGSCRIPPPSDETVMLQVGSVSMSVKTADGQSQLGADSAAPRASTIDATNLCIGVHLAPELFVLGAVKDATTSFASKLSVSPSIVFSAATGSRQKNFIMNSSVFQIARKEPGTFFDCPSVKERLADNYPSCTQEKRLVAFDGSALYLADSFVPGCISKAYGKDSTRLKFVILLHEPAEHLQSLFYWNSSQRVSPKANFHEFVEELLNRGPNFDSWVLDKQLVGTMSLHSDIAKSDPAALFVHTFYADQIAEYFKVFSPEQFTIVPMKMYVSRHTSPSPVNLVLASVGLPPVPDVAMDEAEVTNTRSHPTLDEDLNATTIKRLRAFLNTYTGATKVARVLVTSAPSAPAPSLVGYAGPRDSQAAIAQWLTENW